MLYFPLLKMKQNSIIFDISTFLVAIAVCSSLFFLAACDSTLPSGNNQTGTTSKVNFGPEKDDWVFDPSNIVENKNLLQKAGSVMTKTLGGARMMESVAMDASAGNNIGFSVGGAKDINNFRENINSNYLPVPTDITYEGLFYDYYFETGQDEVCNDLFCPSYSYAITQDPFSEADEYYLSVGLNSNIKESDFQRKNLNLVIVLDISGSMSSAFNRYYYDNFGNRKPLPFLEEEDVDEDTGSTKMQIASKSIVALLDHLDDDDRLGIVLFDSWASTAKPLNYIGETDMQALEDHILELSPRGGTNMEAGMQEATDLFDDLHNIDKDEYENRIIFLTDAMPNIGRTDEDSLLGMTKRNSKDNIYTTFIGIGVDFNTELLESITKIKGANYYSVHSARQFKTRMDDEFEFMVTPLVFDLLLELDADGYTIEKVFGSPEADEATGEIMKVNTLFPSSQVDAKTKGGIVLLKLKKRSDDAQLNLQVSYEDRSGRQDSSIVEINFPEKAPTRDYFEDSGIRKAILLTRYASLMKGWLMDETQIYPPDFPAQYPVVTKENGIIIPPPFPPDYYPQGLGRWERQSQPLVVSSYYEDLFKEFLDYFEDEMDAIDDNTLNQEVEILKTLIRS